jgi:hypothetical protein
MLKTSLYALVASLVLSGAAQAQIKAEHPRNCVMNVGPTQMMFSAFQEKGDEIFCTNISDTGPTILIFDARQPELRDMTVEVRIVRNIGQKDWRDDLDQTGVAAFPPGKHLAQRSTMNFNHDFLKAGDYIAVVRATSDDGAKEYVGEYFFSVGHSENWYFAAMLGSMAVGLGSFGFLGLARRKNEQAPGAAAPVTVASAGPDYGEPVFCKQPSPAPEQDPPRHS